MRVLLVGNGGREHALAWKLSKSPLLGLLEWAPGNGGAELPVRVVPIASDDVQGLLAHARATRPGLVVVGPEVPLSLGFADALIAEGVPVFGPVQAAARLESSKRFAKEFFLRHNIPTAQHWSFTDGPAALEWVAAYRGEYPLVVKADGLAAGKGVLICETQAQAKEAVEQIMVRREFGGAGETVVIEEFLRGEEASLLAFCDGERAVLMPPARDHKRAFDGDKGPNTGGMGAFCPSPSVDVALQRQVLETVMLPTLRGMAAEGSPFRGVLYAGLMLTEQGPKVLEFNCRFGDPETQVVLPRLDCDLLPILLACAKGRLDEVEVTWARGSCATVVLCSKGYPGDYPKGLEIRGLEEAGAEPGVVVFHAGTRRDGDRVLTAGGRVLNVTAFGTTLAQARERAYAAAAKIRFDGMQFRNDIAGTR